MNSLKTSNVLKSICYIAVPLLIVIIALNSFSVVYYIQNQRDFAEAKDYFETDTFTEDFLYTITRAIAKVNDVKTYDGTKENLEIVNDEKVIYNVSQGESATTDVYVAIPYLIVNDVPIKEINYTLDKYITTYTYDILIIRQDGVCFTNIPKTVSTDTIEELQEYIDKGQYRWIYTNNNAENIYVGTTIKNLQYDYIAYNEYFEEIKNSGAQVYACIKDGDLARVYRNDLTYKLVTNTYKSAPIVISVCCLLLIVSLVYILASIGHKKGYDGIYTGKFEQLPLEVLLVLIGICGAAEFLVTNFLINMIYHSDTSYMVDTGIILFIFMLIIIYVTIIDFFITIVRRIKKHILIKNTICYKIIHFICTGLFSNINKTLKFAILYIMFLVVSFSLLLICRTNPLIIIILCAFLYFSFKKVVDYINKMMLVRKKINNMYHGNVNEPLEESDFTGELKEVAKELNDISGGLSNAVEEAMKSERLKTELITNVSHDIKTPLTSIINYVDLMKKENIKNAKVKEYLQVLDNKSQRLKKLTEDLVEASKASSGNIKLNMEILNVNELIKQISGEFEDKLKEKGLELFETFTDDITQIEADSRYMYRVMENMYTNIVKYALENSRVYIDVVKKNGKAQISLKNISKDKLNISVDELMERFVRGDTSRTTEGSGLGISIAKSLVELQGGKFDIYLDGDLFKVTIEFNAK